MTMFTPPRLRGASGPLKPATPTHTALAASRLPYGEIVVQVQHGRRLKMWALCRRLLVCLVIMHGALGFAEVWAA